MTITSLGTAANASREVGASPRSTLLKPPGCCAVGALDARDQEKAANSERLGVPRRQGLEEPVIALALTPTTPHPPPQLIQEPVKLKRRRDASSADVIWLSKKQHSAVAAAPGLGNANRSPSAPIVQEHGGNMGAVDGLRKKGHGPLEWSSGKAEDQKEEEKVRPCQLATTASGNDVLRQDSEVTVPGLSWPLQIVQEPVKRGHHQNGEDECWLIKKRYHADMVAACKGGNGPVDQLNLAAPSSSPAQGMQESVRRCSIKQKANSAGRGKTAKRSDYKTTEQRYASLNSGLRCLGVTNVIPVFAKTLTLTDSRLQQARLQVSSSSSLMNMLTPGEYIDVHTRDGLAVVAIDRHGCSYDMRFGMVRLSNCIAYRLRKGWTKFLAHSGVRDGDLVEVGAFRIDGRLMLTLLNYTLDGWIQEELEAANGLSMLSNFKDGTKS